MPSLQDIIAVYKMRDLSGDQIKALVGKGPILYSDLGRYKTINQLLGPEKFAIILLQTSNKTTGHFVSVSMNDATGRVRFFDSYGYSPDQILQFTPYDQQLPLYLKALLNGVDYEYNSVDYQSKTPGTSTCGRYACLSVMWRNLTLSQFHELLLTNKDKWLSPDNIVTMLTSVQLHNIRDFFTR